MSSIFIEKRGDIQCLRAVAVISVIAFHVAPRLAPNGYLGVDIFFVISGYLILPKILAINETSSRREALICYKDFLLARFYRLTPALVTVLSISSILMVMFAPLNDHIRYSRQAILSIFGLGNIGAARYAGDYFSPNPNPLTHLWSLAVEQQTYVLLSTAVLIFGFSRGIKKVKIVLSLMTILSVALYVKPFSWSTHVTINNLNIPDYYLTTHRIWEILAGGLCVYSGLRKYSKILGGVSLVFCLGLLVSNNEYDRIGSSVLICVFTLLILNAKFKLDSIDIRIKKLFVQIGNASYSIYLIHLPVVYLFDVNRVFSHSSFTRFIVIAIISVSTGFICFETVEKKYIYTKSAMVVAAKIEKRLGLIALSGGILTIAMATSILPRVSGLYPALESKGISSMNWDRSCKSHDTDHPCLYGKNLNQFDILIGDSHAAMLSKPLRDATLEQGIGLAVWTKSNCKFNIYPSSILDEECLIHNKSVLAWSNSLQIRNIYASYNNANQKEMLDLQRSLEFLGNEVHEIFIFTPIPTFNNSRYFSPRIDVVNQANLYWWKKHKKEKFHILDTGEFFNKKDNFGKILQMYYQDYSHLNLDGASMLVQYFISRIGNSRQFPVS